MDELSEFMDNRGTPVIRLPVLGKKSLDLYELYKLVCARGGLLEVINKKLWQEVIRGLKLPTITSGAYTLKNQYIKILYPFECEKRKFSRLEDLDPTANVGKEAYTEPFKCFEPTLSPLQNLTTTFGVFDKTASPLNPIVTQQSFLMRCLKIMEDQKRQQEELEVITPENIKREREDDDDYDIPSKKSLNSPKEVDVSTLGMQFSLKSDENGQLKIRLELNGVQYESDLKVVE